MKKITLLLFVFHLEYSVAFASHKPLIASTYQDDREKARKEMYGKIEKNQEKIAQLRSELKSGKSKVKKTEKEISDLELKNKKLKERLDSYDEKSDWKKFKKDW